MNSKQHPFLQSVINLMVLYVTCVMVTKSISNLKSIKDYFYYIDYAAIKLQF